MRARFFWPAHQRYYTGDYAGELRGLLMSVVHVGKVNFLVPWPMIASVWEFGW